MNQIYPDEGLLYQLGRIVNGSGAGLFWQLYESNTTPSLNSVKADFTLSAAWGKVQKAPADFTLTQVSAHIGSYQATNITFTNNTGSSKTIYGYLILDPTSAFIIGAARLDAAPVTVVNGGTIVITPIIGDSSALSA